uniref:Peptidase M12B propeptide domain-containing protein n=1 Tax=Denticeps clupeoides TaxID=299321 RepID=A0AAY4C008_9TELE
MARTPNLVSFFFFFLLNGETTRVFSVRMRVKKKKKPRLLRLDRLCPPGSLRSVLSDFEVLSVSGLQQHSARKRDVRTRSHTERLLTFSALRRHFRLYLTTNTELFTEDFRAVVVGANGREETFNVQRQNFFVGHVIGEEHSRVQAHINDDDFSAHILTHEAEYNIEPLWRFTEGDPDGRLLIYRSTDIRNASRLASPKVCGYIIPLLKKNLRSILSDGPEGLKVKLFYCC